MHDHPSALSEMSLLVVAVSVLAGLNIGLCCGKYSGLIGNAPFRAYFYSPPDTDIQELMAMLFLMQPLGALFTGHVSDALGRRRCLLAGAIFIASGCLIESLPSLANQIPFKTLLVGRAACGLGLGVLLPMVPLYISETALPQNRGIMQGFLGFFVSAGLLIAYVLQYCLLRKAEGWKICLASQFPLALCLCLVFYIIPESPRWLAQGSDRDGVRHVLSRLRSPIDKQELDAEVDMTMRQSKPARAVGWPDIAAALKEKPSLMAVGLMIWYQGCGIDTITQYAPEMLAHMSGHGADEEQILLGTVWLGVILVLSSSWAFFILDSWGRRPLLLLGAFSAASSMALLAIVETLELSTSVKFAWRMIGMMAFLIAFNVGLVPVCTVVPPELLSSRVRGKVMAVGGTAALIADYATVASYLSLTKQLGQAGTYAMYALINLILAVPAVIYIPETMGCDLDADTIGLLDKNSA